MDDGDDYDEDIPKTEEELRMYHESRSRPIHSRKDRDYARLLCI